MASNDYVTKQTFFQYTGILVTILLVVNGAALTVAFNAVEASESRVNERIGRVESTNSEITDTLTDVRISLQRIETHLGIDTGIRQTSIKTN